MNFYYFVQQKKTRVFIQNMYKLVANDIQLNFYNPNILGEEDFV